MKPIATIALVLGLAATATADEGASAPPTEGVSKSEERGFLHARIVVAAGDKGFGKLTMSDVETTFGPCEEGPAVDGSPVLQCAPFFFSFDAQRKVQRIHASAGSVTSAEAEEYLQGAVMTFLGLFGRKWDDKSRDEPNGATTWIWILDGKVAIIHALKGVPVITYKPCGADDRPCPRGDRQIEAPSLDFAMALLKTRPKNVLAVCSQMQGEFSMLTKAHGWVTYTCVSPARVFAADFAGEQAVRALATTYEIQRKTLGHVKDWLSVDPKKETYEGKEVYTWTKPGVDVRATFKKAGSPSGSTTVEIKLETD